MSDVSQQRRYLSAKLFSTHGHRPAELCESLALIQDHVNALLRMPEEVSVAEAKRINDTAKLLRGEVLSSEGLQTFTVHHDGDQAATLDWTGIYEFFTVHRMSFRLGGATISAGKKKPVSFAGAVWRSVRQNRRSSPTRMVTS